MSSFGRAVGVACSDRARVRISIDRRNARRLFGRLSIRHSLGEVTDAQIETLVQDPTAQAAPVTYPMTGCVRFREVSFVREIRAVVDAC